MLSMRLQLIDAKESHDLGNKIVTIKGNGTIKTIFVNQRIGPCPKLPEVLVCYNLAKGSTDKEEDKLLQTEEDLFAVGKIILSSILGDLTGQARQNVIKQVQLTCHDLLTSHKNLTGQEEQAIQEAASQDLAVQDIEAQL